MADNPDNDWLTDLIGPSSAVTVRGDSHDSSGAAAVRSRLVSAVRDATTKPDQVAVERYRLDEQDRLCCTDSPSVILHAERGLTVSEEQRAGYPPRTIFLDGVFSGAPFMDNERRQCSLDHHHGVVRELTLATCEQVAVVLLQGLPLADGTWHVYLNEPDLDALLAAWMLLNHRQLLHDNAQLLRLLMPLVRVEGLIDAHGLGMEALLPMSEQSYQAERRRIDRLLTTERKLRDEGAWYTVDITAYTRSMLERLDAELYPRGWFDERGRAFQVHGVTVQTRKVAVRCRSQLGIYEVETRLKQRYDGGLALIVLDQGEGRITIKLVDHFMRHDLDDLYPLLNERDPNVDHNRLSDNCWGGSSTIGGSPRKTGTGLTGQQVLAIVSELFLEIH